jgi:molecular chaperone DnaK (HSP70)
VKHVYGIDFGTTNSSIAVMRWNSSVQTMLPYVLPIEPNFSPDTVMKSLVLLRPDGQAEVGQLAGQNAPHVPEGQLVRSVKRQLALERGRTYGVGTKSYSAVDVAAIILAQLKQRADERLSSPGEGAVIGVPVGFDDRQKERLVQAAIKAGIVPNYEAAKTKIRFVAEPVAVALSYGIELQSDQRVMVFDFGGGTLDLTVMDMRYVKSPDALRPNDVLAKGGVNLGGDDIDMLILQKVVAPAYGEARLLAQLGITEWDDLSASPAGWRLLERVEQCKRDLSTTAERRLIFHDGEISIDLLLTQSELKRHLLPMLEQITNLIHSTLTGANQGRSPLRPSDISQVIMAGGSSLIPAVRERLMEIFGSHVPVQLHANPLTSIAEGLARVTDLSDSTRKVVNDITDFAYGLWDHGRNAVAIIVPDGISYKDTQVNRTERSGIFERFNVRNPSSDFLAFEIHQVLPDGSHRLLHDVKIKITRGPQTPEGRFQVFFTIDEDKGWLDLHVWDEYEAEWIASDRLPLCQYRRDT